MAREYYSEPMRDPEGYLTEEQFKHLVSFADSPRDRLLLNFLFYSGRRVSEVVRSIKVEDCDFRNNTILFSILKKRFPLKKRLNVDIGLMEKVKEYVENERMSFDEFLFPINRFRVDQIIKNISKKAEMEFIGRHKIHAHTFRHSFAVMMVKRIKDIYELGRLQNQLQHGSLEQTAFYFEHFNPKERDFIDVSRDKTDSEEIEEK